MKFESWKIWKENEKKENEKKEIAVCVISQEMWEIEKRNKETDKGKSEKEKESMEEQEKK